MFEDLTYIGNTFPSIVFNNVKRLTVKDEISFKHDFFNGIALSFPLLEELCVINIKPQSLISDKWNSNDNQLYSIIKYPYLISLRLVTVHIDYIDQFLNERKTHLPCLTELTVNYNNLLIVTENFTRDTIRLNCMKIKKLNVGERIEHTKDLYFFKMQRGTLILEDDSKFDGFVFGASTNVTGEVVFQTGIVGYTESLTDPSYCGQILVLTSPLIGNYGVPDEKAIDDFGIQRWVESNKIYASGLIVSTYTEQYNHWNAVESLSSWLNKHNVPGIDTHMLTKKLREHGTMLGKIFMKGTDPTSIRFQDQNKTNLMIQVSIEKQRVFNPTGKISIACIDCGLKNSQLRILCQLDAKVTVFPWNYSVKQDEFDGLFLSSGPGNPQTQCRDTIATIKSWIDSETIKPVFGISLGHQLMALAAGMKITKLKYGNRGYNQPCLLEGTQRCFITSQNHGFAVEKVRFLPSGWSILFTNQNDQSIEGIIHDYKPFFSVEFYPEYCTEPHDIENLFKIFVDVVQSYRSINVKSYLIEQLTKCYIGDNKSPKAFHDQGKKVLVLGSDILTFGQAGEFDYSAIQAVQALKEENIYTILINPSNITLDQTSIDLPNKIFCEQITDTHVLPVIREERPYGMLLSFGERTALHCGIRLHEENMLAAYLCNILGEQNIFIC
ncbi:unnamed protein product [Rotaria sp. Silwood2]|nr:unnamed protein product [Rotaria sp. Silwood2]